MNVKARKVLSVHSYTYVLGHSNVFSEVDEERKHVIPRYLEANNRVNALCDVILHQSWMDRARGQSLGGGFSPLSMVD